ncbi:MAG: pantoate--beta-alanine ligase [Acidobacteriota bacterium]
MQIVRTIADVRRLLRPLRGGRTIALVPTMGAFHDGHAALFRTAAAASDYVVASLFVNPTQFGSPADLAAYPRNEPRDARIAEESGVDLLFAPAVDEMFHPDHATWIAIEGAAQGLEDEFRPNHFRGVATVCLKLFTIVHPHLAFFGQKDAQQVAVIKQLTRDLNLDLEIRVEPTVRDADGLALSSRNVRLSAEERQRALSIPRALHAGHAAYLAGGDAVAAARAMLVGLEAEYVAIANFDGQPTLAIAARVGATRLIDNIPLGGR